MSDEEAWAEDVVAFCNAYLGALYGAMAMAIFFPPQRIDE